MANNCFYQIKAVSPKKENLERLLKIMKYEDAEYFIYRCFSADTDGEINDEEGLYSVLISGDVAWSCDKWFSTEENKECIDENGTAHYITLDLLCERLDIAMELYSEESGCGFQEHYIVDNHGLIIDDECVDWTEVWTDEDGNDLDEPIVDGGFECYGDFSFANELYDYDDEDDVKEEK